MSPTSPRSPTDGYLPIVQIRQRLAQVYAESCHLRQRLNPDSAHNRILTLVDISRFIKEYASGLDLLKFSKPVPIGEVCPDWRKITPELQRRLSDFFMGWDAGTLVKARQGNDWKIFNRTDPTLATVDAAQVAQTHARPPIACQADFQTGSLKVR